ncbi:hypothetical protein BBJK_01011 [Bifidobacterium bifidum LMG 13195]|uniref:Uncharacterized protein n=1 Tax=Bifidobacterium bifidum LMG 13195 TaxID=1207542 RepID=A0A286TBN2_BIFBI|nr:hypothetical protein BBJK_01011 [Bifidobacterium bifidum LMG 13195]
MNTDDVPILRGQAGWLAIESAYANTIAGVDPDDQPTINELLKNGDATTRATPCAPATTSPTTTTKASPTASRRP